MLDLYKIGNRIALLRREKGLTGEKLAESLGVSPQAVSKWENGKNLPETALLPALAALLEVSIDSILIPQELVILDARYTCGDSYIVVTDALNREVEGNSLTFMAKCPIGGYSLEGSAVFVLTVKYQTPDGTFYAFSPQGETLELSLSSKLFTANEGFDIIGAYYGVGSRYKSVMEKMRHYDYFKWDEIYVNHETFPSSPGIDESEYLTLVYMNKDGIHVISCEENGVLRYSNGRTSLEVKDTSSCILPGVAPLSWGQNMDCCWGGSIYTALKYIGESYTYEQIMGMSGACYRINFTEVWDWSATDALVAFDYSDILFNAIGYEQVWADRLDKDKRSAERKLIVSDIQMGKPVVAINLRVAAEWGVITGYTDNGKTLYCRTYFDGDLLSENGKVKSNGDEYLETENWPFMLVHFGKKVERPSGDDILKASLQALIDSFRAPCERGYWQGEEAYKKWIEGLKNDSLWDLSNARDDFYRRASVNECTLRSLIDERRCAAVYLGECGQAGLSEMYQGICERVKSFYEKWINRWDKVSADGDEWRSEEICLLKSVLETEREIAKKAEGIIENWGTSFAHAFCHGELNDAALKCYSVIYAHIPSLLPDLYEINRDDKMVVVADLKKDNDYVPGFHYDEDNENGEFIRQSYQKILQSAAKWHTAFWENGDAFGQIGLDWRFETKENLMAHISMMEKDFKKYRKNEEAGKIPKVWEGNFNGEQFRIENNIAFGQLDYFTNAAERLKNEYWELVEARFHTGKNITVIHGDMHPGTANVSKSNEGTVKFNGLQAVRMGLPTEDLAMLIALHIEPDKQKAQPLLDGYYRCLCESVKDYPYETFMNDYKIAVMENMFFTVRLINNGIYDFKMRDKAIRAYESFVLDGSG